MWLWDRNFDIQRKSIETINASSCKNYFKAEKFHPKMEGKMIGIVLNDSEKSGFFYVDKETSICNVLKLNAWPDLMITKMKGTIRFFDYFDSCNSFFNYLISFPLTCLLMAGPRVGVTSKVALPLPSGTNPPPLKIICNRMYWVIWYQ